jgi:hypothetical protein
MEDQKKKLRRHRMSNMSVSDDGVQATNSGKASQDFVFENEAEMGKIVLHDQDRALSQKSDVASMIIAVPVLVVVALTTLALVFL